MSAHQRSNRNSMEDIWAIERRLDLEERVQLLAERRKEDSMPLATALPRTLRRVLEMEQRVIEGQQCFIDRMQRDIDQPTEWTNTEWAREMIERGQVIIAISQQTVAMLLSMLAREAGTISKERRGPKDRSNPHQEQQRSLSVVDSMPKLPAPAAAS